MIEPVPKFEPIVIDELEEFACITLIVATEAFNPEKFPVVDCRVVMVPFVD